MHTGRSLLTIQLLAVGLFLARGSDCAANQTLANPPSNFVDCTHSIPSSILALCIDSRGLIAAPGEKWNATDVVDDKVPSNLLIWAISLSDSYSDIYYVHYETGGYVDTWYVTKAVIGKIDHKTRVVGRVNTGPFLNYGEFVSKLKGFTFLPNQSTDPTLSSGTPVAGQPARHP
jgi:hypothetical protein